MHNSPPSRHWIPLRLVLCVLAYGATLAIAISQEHFRRTDRGWEAMETISTSSTLRPSADLVSFPTLTTWVRIHRCIVPVSVASFMAFSGAWFLMAFGRMEPHMSHST